MMLKLNVISHLKGQRTFSGNSLPPVANELVKNSLCRALNANYVKCSVKNKI